MCSVFVEGKLKPDRGPWLQGRVINAAVWPGGSPTTSLSYLSSGTPVFIVHTCSEGRLAPSPLNTPIVEPPGLPVYSRPLSGLEGDRLGLLCSLLPSSPTSVPPARRSGGPEAKTQGCIPGEAYEATTPPMPSTEYALSETLWI